MFGNKKQEHCAVNVTAPAATEILKGELYRIDGWTGFALAHINPADPVFGSETHLALDISGDIWYCTIPSGLVDVDRGDLLYWTAGTGFKVGSTDLTVAGGGALGPVAKVEEEPDVNNVAALMPINTNAVPA